VENDIITFLVVICGFSGFVGLIVTISLAHRRQLELLKAELEIQTRFIEKLSSGSELRDYLDAHGLTAIAEAMRPRPDDTYYRLVSIVMAGCVVTVVGCGLYIPAGLHNPGNARQTLFLLATIVLACGIGLLLAAAVGRALVRKLANSGHTQQK
jgi:hypothetical protein